MLIESLEKVFEVFILPEHLWIKKFKWSLDPIMGDFHYILYLFPDEEWLHKNGHLITHIEISKIEKKVDDFFQMLAPHPNEYFAGVKLIKNK